MPRQTVTLDGVAKLAAATELEVRQRLIAATRGASEELDLGRAFPAAQALPTYRVRLQSWNNGLLPTMCGFPAFVAALEAAGDQSVLMAVYQEPERRFVLLLSADAATLLAIVEIGRGPEPGPEWWMSRDGSVTQG
jgi:hypothetical protein